MPFLVAVASRLMFLMLSKVLFNPGDDPLVTEPIFLVSREESIFGVEVLIGGK